MATEIQLSKAGAMALADSWNAGVGKKKPTSKTKPDSKATANKKKKSSCK